MAIVIESTTQVTSYADVIDIGSSGTFFVTKPEGLVVGDMLIVFTSTTRNATSTTPSAGWTEITLDPVVQEITRAFYKLADAGDVAGTGWTFGTSRDDNDYLYHCYRLSGTATMINPVIASVGQGFNLPIGATDISEDVNMFVPDGTLLLAVAGGDLNFDNTNFSSHTFVGVTGTVTEVIDRAATTDEQFLLVQNEISTGGTISSYDFVVDVAVSTQRSMSLNVLAVFPQADETATPEFLEDDSATFDVRIKAAASATIQFLEEAVDIVNPVKVRIKSNLWNDIAKPVSSAIAAVNKIFTSGDNHTFTSGDNKLSSAEQDAREWVDIDKP